MAASSSGPGAELLEQQIRSHGEWFHNFTLRGIETAPNHFLGDYPRCKFARFSDSIPEDLTGKSVLDIGCNAGFYSIEMKRRNAARVVGLDFDERYLNQGRLAAEVLGMEIEFRKMSVYDIKELGEKFDVVFFMGVLYHLRHPLLALDLIFEHAARDLLVFQSMQRGSDAVAVIEQDYEFWNTDVFEQAGYPQMYFVEHCYAGDPTNWWIPNKACTQAMLRSAGFEIIENPEEEVFICQRQESPWRRDLSADKHR